MVTPEEFEQYVTEALDNLPDDLRARISNLSIVIEEWADHHTLELAGLADPRELQGFYHGIPLPQRGRGYHLTSPDHISIYRRPILLRCRSRAQAREEVRRVVWHELAHHFGVDDERLVALGAY
jgi:predicted Zn-dependent protease with MMP-like domain